MKLKISRDSNSLLKTKYWSGSVFRLESTWVCAPGRLGFWKAELEEKRGLD